jgi:hypothetical protein
MRTRKLLLVLQVSHSKIRTSNPGAAGSMRDNLMGLAHLEHGRIPISARENSGLG